MRRPYSASAPADQHMVSHGVKPHFTPSEACRLPPSLAACQASAAETKRLHGSMQWPPPSFKADKIELHPERASNAFDHRHTGATGDHIGLRAFVSSNNR